MLSSFAPWCAETCISASERESQKPHQGFAGQNPIPHRGIAWSKSTLALGLPEWAGKTASGPAVAANNDAANNGTPQTPQKTPCAVPRGNHLSMGVSGQVATVNPFTSGGGGVWGANQQSFGPTTNNYTYSGGGAGLDVSASVQSVWAWGSGSWTGRFNSISASAGPFSGSIFWTSGKGGWTGASFGLDVGSPGAAYAVTNYTCKSGPR
jgi:hypothetical protein